MRQCPKCGKRFLESSARICDQDGAVLDMLVVASERDRLVGTTILNRYAIDGVLGDGGMGVVYRARSLEDNRRYAVKVLRAEYSQEEDLVVRFEQEARSAAQVQNPHIVEIYDWGSLPDGSRFFVMEYLEGRSLGDLLARMPKSGDRREPLPEDFAIHLAMQVADGLGAAHAIGIVHRDIKPDNFHIIRRPEDPYFVKILDFGIAKVQNSKAARTRTGSVFGTPHYMSPEQASGERNIDAKTDIYGLGVLMYEMVVGKVPFDADNLMGILTAHLYHTPVPPRAYLDATPPVKVSASFEAIILRCLAKEREARYDSMAELYEDLARVRRGETSSALEEQEVSTVRFDRAQVAGLMDADMAARTRAMHAPAAPEPLAAPVIAASLLPPVPPTPTPAPMQPMGIRGNTPAPGIPLAPQNGAIPAGATGGYPQQPPAPQSGPPGSPFDLNTIRFADSSQQTPTPFVETMAPPPVAQRNDRRKRSAAPIIAAVLGSGTAIGVALFALLGIKQPAPASPRNVPVAVDSQVLNAPTPLPARDVPTAPNVPAPNTLAPSHVVPNTPQGAPVQIRSNAPGAQVYRGDTLIGNAPQSVARPASGQDTYTVMAEGYEPREVSVTPNAPATLTATLARAPRGRNRTPRRTPNATPRQTRQNPGTSRTQTPTRPDPTAGSLRDPWAVH
jgi:serine/threonine protein kinase